MNPPLDAHYFVDADACDEQGFGQKMAQWLNERRWVVLCARPRDRDEVNDFLAVVEDFVGKNPIKSLGHTWHFAGASAFNVDEQLQYQRAMYFVVPKTRRVRNELKKLTGYDGEQRDLVCMDGQLHAFAANLLDQLTKEFRDEVSLN